jgi:hypothetical protein
MGETGWSRGVEHVHSGEGKTRKEDDSEMNAGDQLLDRLPNEEKTVSHGAK